MRRNPKLIFRPEKKRGGERKSSVDSFFPLAVSYGQPSLLITSRLGLLSASAEREIRTVLQICMKLLLELEHQASLHGVEVLVVGKFVTIEVVVSVA